ncbi:MAG: substrate-binding domain-containing protein, partial [Cellulophaga sp.]
NVGCKNIAILSTPDHVNVGALRTIGYKRALEEKGITINEDLIFKVNDNSSITEQISAFMHNSTLNYDGVVAVNEIYAANVIKIAKEKDLQIPNELCVVGFTDGLISSFSTPSLSTIDQHGITIGEHAAELLLDRIQNKDINKEYQRKVISTDLIIRKSSEKNTVL